MVRHCDYTPFCVHWQRPKLSLMATSSSDQQDPDHMSSRISPELMCWERGTGTLVQQNPPHVSVIFSMLTGSMTTAVSSLTFLLRWVALQVSRMTPVEDGLNKDGSDIIDGRQYKNWFLQSKNGASRLKVPE